MNIFPKQFRFSFIKNGVITYCKHGPEEWNDNVIKWNRDAKTYSILTKYAINFTFVLEDADYLRECFNTTGVFSKVRFNVEEYNTVESIYKSYYSGDLDFYNYEEDEYRVQMPAGELGYKITFDSNYDTDYEITIPKSLAVNYDRLILKNKISFSCDFNIYNNIQEGNYFFSAYINEESIYSKILSYQSISQSVFSNQPYTENWIAKGNGSVRLHIKFYLAASYFSIMAASKSNPGQIIVSLFNSSIGVSATRTINLIADPFDPSDTSFGYPVHPEGFGLVDFDTTVENGEYIRIMIAPKGNFKSISINNAPLSIEFDSRGKERKVYGIRPIDLLKELVSKATANKYNLIKSSLLTTSEVSNMLITSGDLIRNIEGAKIKTSLKDFFESFKVISGASYMFDVVNGEERLVVEHINNMFRNDLLLASVCDVRDFKKTIANDYIFNKLKIGYKDKNYNEVDGKYEFNTELQFSIDTNSKGNELKLISPYRADIYGIEFIIANYEDQDSTDSKDDNDIFIIHTGSNIDNHTVSLNRVLKTKNSPAKDSVFNVYLSPMHCLTRQIEYIKSLFKFSGETLIFTSSPKDFSMISEIGEEHNNVWLGADNILFTPIFYEFETMVPENISELIEVNYNGYVEVNTGGKIIKGFVHSLSENPGRKKSQTWKLLALN
ncbi:MAG: hypothetical protein RR137_08945 [Odoribacter sp.]